MTAQIAPWAGRLAVFDTETTGVNVFHDRIVTATLALLDDGAVVHRRDWMLNPGVQIPAAATAVHGITTEVAAASGIDPATGVAQIVEQITDALERGYALVVFNANFDLTLLTAEAARHGVGIPSDFAPVLDPYIIDRWLDRYRRGKRTLASLCAHYGVPLTDAHDAAADALATGGVLRVLATKFATELPHDPRTLHTQQIAWEEELTLSFRDWLSRQGRPADDVVPGWPLRRQQG